MIEWLDISKLLMYKKNIIFLADKRFKIIFMMLLHYIYQIKINKFGTWSLGTAQKYMQHKFMLRCNMVSLLLYLPFKEFSFLSGIKQF